MRPMLASDAVEDKIVFPCIAQPKIDGVRGMNMLGPLTGRSLKSFANIHATNFFSMGAFKGFDGEFAAEHECHPDLCRLTTSALNSIQGEPWLLWHVFDYITEDTFDDTYSVRYEKLKKRVDDLWKTVDSRIVKHLKVVPSRICLGMKDLLAHDDAWLDMGHEGTIVRSPVGMHKQGRSTVREGGLLRIKRFIDFEFEITELIEGEANGNEAQTNELGLQFRSTHQENMVPNGMVGAMMGRILKDVTDAKGVVLFPKDTVVKVGAGSMPHADREMYFKNPHLLLKQIGKAKTFPKGVKDKPRFPTFQSLRSMTDM